MKCERYGISKALEFLHIYIQNLKASQKKELKSIRFLAKEAGVGVSTMAKAVRIFRNNGIIEGCAKTRYQVCSTSDSALADTIIDTERKSATLPVWEKTAHAIEKDILQGTLASDGIVPQMKQLQSLYGISFLTLKKSLSYLEERKVITRHGKQYRKTIMKRLPNKKNIIFIARGFKDNKLLPHDELTMRLFLDMAFKTYGIDINVFTIHIETGQGRWSSDLEYVLSHPDSNSPVFGIIFWTLGVPANTAFTITSQYLLFQNCPVAIFDEDGILPRTLFKNKKKQIACFRKESEQKSGEAVARYLLGKNRRKIKYLNSALSHPWSKERYAGIFNYAKQIGETCSEIALPVSDIDATVLHDEIYPLLYNKITQRSEPYQHLIRLQSLILNHIYLDRSINRIYRHKSLYTLLEQQFDAITDADAVVCCEDDLAVICIEFIKTKGIKIPDDIALISFDNSTESSIWQFSSYDFNRSAIVKAILEYILGNSWIGSHKKVTGHITIEGYVVERSTT